MHPLRGWPGTGRCMYRKILPSVESIRTNQIKKMVSNSIISKRLPLAADWSTQRYRDSNIRLSLGNPI